MRNITIVSEFLTRTSDGGLEIMKYSQAIFWFLLFGVAPYTVRAQEAEAGSKEKSKSKQVQEKRQ